MTYVLPLFALLLACGGPAGPRPTPPSDSLATTADTVSVPKYPAQALASRKVVARGVNNPRGMQMRGAGELLVAASGTGDPEHPNTGQLLLLTDKSADGDFLDKGESQVLLDEQPSKNILHIVRRDEVFGMAGMDQGPDGAMVALAFFGGPTTLFMVEGKSVRPWGSTHLNINDVAYDPGRKIWLGVASTTDEVVKLMPERGAQRVMKVPTLASGQDAVPGYLRHDPLTGDVLVSLFTGSPEGEEGGDGTELVPHAGGILRVNPDTGKSSWLVTGLSVPTDLEIGEDGAIYVLEFCNAFLDPVGDRAAMFAGTSHGGFKRFSGRLLRIDRTSRQTTVVADGLDAPSNLARAPGGLYIAEGMGTPGRQIPGPDGKPIALEGFIEHVSLP